MDHRHQHRPSTPCSDSNREDLSGDLSVLIRRVAARNSHAFRQIYDLQAPRLYGIALRITRRTCLAADAMQDAFLQVWQNAGRFDGAADSPELWLISLVRYRALDIVRCRGREIPVDYVPDQIDGIPDAFDQLAVIDNTAILHTCFSPLEPNGRRLLILAFVDGFTHIEIAEHLHLPIETVKSDIRRSLQLLRPTLPAISDGAPCQSAAKTGAVSDPPSHPPFLPHSTRP